MMEPRTQNTELACIYRGLDLVLRHIAKRTKARGGIVISFCDHGRIIELTTGLVSEFRSSCTHQYNLPVGLHVRPIKCQTSKTD